MSSINDIIKSNKPSIVSIKKDYGDEVVKAMLFLEIENFVNFMNLGKNMNEMQIIETVKLVQKNFYYFSLLDFKLFFDRMKEGFYGQFYDRLDGSVILSNLMKYEDERMQEYERVNYGNRNRFKSQEEKGVSNIRPEIIDIAKKVLEKKPIPEKKTAVSREKTKEELMIQRWMNQFDNLFLKYGENKGIRTLNFKGKRIDINEFLKIKMNNYNE